jgi:anti-sigma-K factor RskA
MTDAEDIDGLAAEYVLGSLSLEERRDVDARRRSDHALDEAVTAWERRLDTLGDFIPGVEPPAHLYEAIAVRLWGQPVDVSLLQRTVRRWRRVAIAASALAAVLAVVAVPLLHNPPAPPNALIAVLQKSPAGHTADEAADVKGPPAFVVTIDMHLKTISVTPVAARPVPKRSFALWLERPAAPPVPLGVVAHSEPTAVPWPIAEKGAQYQPAALLNATLLISLEPEGGVAATPTGPILFEGRLAPIGTP